MKLATQQVATLPEAAFACLPDALLTCIDPLHPMLQYLGVDTHTCTQHQSLHTVLHDHPVQSHIAEVNQQLAYSITCEPNKHT